MTFNSVLASLLELLDSTSKPIMVVNWDSIQTWPGGVLEKLVEAGILIPAAKAQSLECLGCEHRCFMDVVTQTSKNKSLACAFIVCDEPDMQSQMGKIEISLERLQQWKCSAKQFAEVIAGLLDIEDKIEYSLGQNNIRIGVLKGSKGRRWVSLNTNPLSLEINRHIMSVEEVLFFEGEQLTLDKLRINGLVNSDPQSKGKKYNPSTDKRAASKLKTKAMHQDWKDAYLKLKKEHSGKSDTWCALKITKMDISQGKSSETIRKNMK